ncbi:MAG: TIGR02996 domain-containing protein [Myxococcota bacterium]
MRVEPGLGWGEAKLGSTMRELVRAFGQPSKTNDFDDYAYPCWESQGLEVSIAKATKKVEVVTLYGRDPEQATFSPARLDGSDLEFGMSEAQLLEVLGPPTAVFRDPGGTWSRLTFAGLNLRLVRDALVSIGIEHPGQGNEEVKITNPELEAAIAAAPDDGAGYLVFGDWLLQQGHPRGALVAAQAAGESIDRRTDDEVLGPVLSPLADMLTERSWRLGFLEKVRVASNFDRSPLHDGAREHVPVSEVLSLLLSSLAGRFLRDLTIGITDFEDNDYVGEMGVLAAMTRPLLRSLYLGDFSRDETELNWSRLGHAGALWAALPQLREVTLRAGSMELGELVLPELRSFTTLTGGLRKAELESIARAQWPKLERLSVQIGSRRYGSDVSADDFGPLLERVPPTVRHLGLTNTEHSDALVPILAGAKLLPQLKELDLSLGTLGEEGAAALLANQTRFAHLEKLDLSESWLTPEWVGRLRDAFPHAVLDEQRYDERYPDDRYIAAGE